MREVAVEGDGEMDDMRMEQNGVWSMGTRATVCGRGRCVWECTISLVHILWITISFAWTQGCIGWAGVVRMYMYTSQTFHCIMSPLVSGGVRYLEFIRSQESFRLP